MKIGIESVATRCVSYRNLVGTDVLDGPKGNKVNFVYAIRLASNYRQNHAIISAYIHGPSGRSVPTKANEHHRYYNESNFTILIALPFSYARTSPMPKKPLSSVRRTRVPSGSFVPIFF